MYPLATSVTTADIIPEWKWKEIGQLLELSEKDLKQLQAEYGSPQADSDQLCIQGWLHGKNP